MALPSMGHWVSGRWMLHPWSSVLLDFKILNQCIPPKLLAILGQSFFPSFFIS